MGWDPFKWINNNIIKPITSFVGGLVGGLLGGRRSPTIDIPGQENPGVKQRTPIDARERTPVIYGRQAWKGQLHHVYARQSPNNIGYYVIRLAERLDSWGYDNFINDVYIEENKISWNGTYPRPSPTVRYLYYTSGIANVTDLAGNTVSDFNNKVQIIIYPDGTQGSSFDEAAGAWSDGYRVGISDPWFASPANRMTAYTFAAVGIAYDAKKSISGLPDMTWFVENALSNPAYAIWDYLLSSRYGCGGELAWDDINGYGNYWSIDTASTYCNQLVSNINPTTNASVSSVLYRIDYVANTTSDRWTNLQTMARSMSGHVRQSVITGLVEIVYDRPQDSLFSVDDSYYIGGLDITQKDISTVPNFIEVSYARNDQLYKNQEDTFTLDLTQNNPTLKERKASYKYTSVGNAPQANRLASIEVAKAQDARIFNFTSDARLYGLETGDVITLSSVVSNITNQLVRILQIDVATDVAGLISMKFLCEAYSIAAVTANSVATALEVEPPSSKSPRALASFTPSAPQVVDALMRVDLGGLQIQATVPQFNTTDVVFRYRLQGTTAYTQFADVFTPNISGYFNSGDNVTATFPRIASGYYLISYLLNNGINIASNWSDELLLAWFPNTLYFTQQYAIVRYADSITGTGISVNPAGKRFLGLFNSYNTTSMMDPGQFQWFDLGANLSAMNRFFVRNLGNRSIVFQTGANTPDPALWTDLYEPLNPANPVIDLDAATGFVVKNAYTAGGSNFLTSVVSPTGEITFLMPNGTSTPGVTPIGSVSALNVDAQGRLAGFTATDKIYVTITEFTATTINETFTFSHVTGQALVFMDGILLDPSEYVETAGTPSPSIQIPHSFAGATVLMARFTQSNAAGTTPIVPFTRTTFNSVAGQTLYSATYEQGTELLFLNGVFYNDTDYSYSGGVNTITLSSAPIASSNIFTIIAFTRFNNGAVSFSQAAGATTAASTAVTLTGNFNVVYTIASKNGLYLSPSDYTLTTNSFNFALAALFTGEAVQITSWAGSGPAVGAAGASGAAGAAMDPSANEQFPQEPQMLTLDEKLASLQNQIDQLRNNL